METQEKINALLKSIDLELLEILLADLEVYQHGAQNIAA